MIEAFRAAPGFWIGWAVMSIFTLIASFEGKPSTIVYPMATAAAILGWIGFGIYMNKRS